MGKARVRCPAGQQRFTVIVVNDDPKDSHAGRSFAEAMDLALPDPGSRVDVWRTCAPDSGAARLFYDQHGEHLRSFRSRGGR